MISSRIQNIQLSGTMEISAKLIELKNSGMEAYDLCVGEPDLPTPEHIKDAAIRAINENKTKYTLNNGIAELRKAVSDKFLNEYNAKYDINEIIITNGAKQAVYNALHATIDEGDEVLIPVPYYVSYPHMVKLAGGIPKFIPASFDDNEIINHIDLSKHISNRTKSIIICNPNNPTGAVYDKKQLKVLIEFAEENNLLIISDEIYEKLIYDSVSFHSISSYSEKHKDRLIIINGVSKSFAMTGWRIGYAAAGREIISGMNKIQSHSTSNACTISQYAALEALTSAQNSVDEQRAIFEERRNLVNNILLDVQGINFKMPKGAFYFFINIEEILQSSNSLATSKEFCLRLLNEAHVATVPGSVFGQEGYIRISYAKSKDELEKALLKMRRFIENSL